MSEQEFTLPEERRIAAYRALGDAGINSPGPNLADLADSVLVEVADRDLEGADDSDVAHEIADSAVPVYTSDIMAAISEDAGLATWEPELGPAFGGEPTPTNIAAGVLYELARNIADAAIRERREREAERLEELEDSARELGEDAAKSAASWATDGNSDVAERRRVLEMLRNGDPAADDFIPRRPDLSGEFADAPTPQSVARELTGEDDPDSEIIDALADAWLDGVSDAFGPAVEAELIRFTEADK